MNRADFQKLSRLRIREAKVLLDSNNYAGAYYLTGYAVECALKACIARQTKRYDFPLPPETVRSEIYTHDITKLPKSAGLIVIHKQQLQTNAQFMNSWGVVKDWSEQSRYDYSITSARAHDLYTAVADRRNGVLAWLKKYW